MYSNKFVVAVLVNGIPVQEKANGEIQIPFGTTYSLRFRNKHDRRAVVQFTVDGENVSEGGYLIPARSFIDIERHAHSPTKFKFVDLDSPDAVDFGKNGPNLDKEKGTIVAAFFLEKEVPKPDVKVVEHHHHYNNYDRLGGHRRGIVPGTEFRTISGKIQPSYGAGGQHVNYGSSLGPSMDWCASRTDSESIQVRATSNMAGMSMMPQDKVQDGCTVEGGYSSQRFREVHLDLEETSTVIRLFMRGYEEKQPVIGNAVSKNTLAQARAENMLLEVQILEAKKAKLLKELAELNTSIGG